MLLISNHLPFLHQFGSALSIVSSTVKILFEDSTYESYNIVMFGVANSKKQATIVGTMLTL